MKRLKANYLKSALAATFGDKIFSCVHTLSHVTGKQLGECVCVAGTFLRKKTKYNILSPCRIMKYEKSATTNEKTHEYCIFTIAYSEFAPICLHLQIKRRGSKLSSEYEQMLS